MGTLTKSDIFIHANEGSNLGKDNREVRRVCATLRLCALRTIKVISLWSQKYRQRRDLMALSDESLRDIGVSKSEAMSEAHQSFWK